jgi:PqqD family protein of HPr-rel-A system
MSAARRDERWKVSFPTEVRFRRLDDEALVFNPARWETRLLTTVSAAVFEALRKSPATAEELAATVAGLEPAGASPAEIQQRVREILDELNRFDLIRPCAGFPDANR